MEENVKSLADIIAIVKRRRWYLLIPALLIFTLAAAAALLLPRTYKSTSTILIEEQEIPKEYVTTTVTSYVEQRLQTINQRVMSSTKLLEIINRFNLYPELKDKKTVDEIVQKMRKDIKMDTISADVVDPRTGRPTAATLAFSLSYQGNRPETVQQISTVLASLYLEENLKVREQQTQGTSKFLEDEMGMVKASLTAVEARIAAFKQRNIEALPELAQVNMQGLDRTENDINRLNDQLRTLKEREGYLTTQLVSIAPDSVDQDKTRLKELRVQLGNLRSRVSEEYPDVAKTKAEIAALEKRLKHGGSKAETPDNPAYIALSAQLASTRSEIDSVRRQIGQINRNREGYRRRIESTPRVEEGYKAMMMERDNLQAKYDDLSKKFMESKVAGGLEKQQMGERFTIIDAARLPEKPVSPNVPAILLIGLILGIGAGVGSAALREFGDKAVYSPEALTRATGLPVLASIPLIASEQEVVQVDSRKRLMILGGVVCLVLGVLLFHFFVMDLDVFWARLARRLGA